MTFGKRQLVIAALVASLGAAVYLNWQFSGSSPAVETQTPAQSSRSSDSSLGKTTYVNTTPSQQSSKAVSEETSSEESSDKESAGAFDKERKKRARANAEALEVLTDTIESAGTSEQAKKDAVAASEALAKAVKVTGDLENMIAQKGFEDVYVSINNDSCAVAVKGGELTDEALLAIRDMVNRQAGISFDRITVSCC